MREILFRGKQRTMLDWVEGTGVFNDGTNTWLSANESNKPIAGGLNHKIVLPETIGQYTGLTDKNGKKIFEGDVCRFYGTDGYSDYVVFWDDTVSQWTVRQIDLGAKDVLDGYFTECCEIIGNIHDNPELLGGVGDG